MHPLYERLLEAVSPAGPWSSISIETRLRPTGPPGTKVAPPSYPVADDREHPYLVDKRWLDGETRKVVLLDSPQSQANRCEVALRDAADDDAVALPMFELVTDVDTDAGVQRVRLTSLDFPHRYADAYLRDAMLDGTKFDATEIGKAFRRADARNALPLYQREPYSLVYGAWDSHRPGRQAKFPRIYDSVTIGLDPEVGVRQGGRLDPMNLTGAIRQTAQGWEYVAEGEKKKGSRLSEIGHGNALDSGGAHGHVAIKEARRLCQIHLSALRGLRFGPEVSTDARTAGRAALLALALLGDRLAFDRASVFLRSSCDLARVEETLLFENPAGDDEPFTLGVDDAVALFNDAVDVASEAGLSMDRDVITITPQEGIEKAIAHAYVKAEDDDG